MQPNRKRNISCAGDLKRKKAGITRLFIFFYRPHPPDRFAELQPRLIIFRTANRRKKGNIIPAYRNRISIALLYCTKRRGLM